MKVFIYFFLLVIVLLHSINCMFASDFPYEVDFREVNMFNGVVGNDEVVIIYSDFGILQSSRDGGHTWKIQKLGDSNDVKKMIYYNNAFYGVSDYFLFKSTDNGENWTFKNINSTTFDYVVKDFQIFKDKIYLPLNDKVRVYDLEFQEQPLEYIQVGETIGYGAINLSNQEMSLFIDSTRLLIYNIDNNSKQIYEFEDIVDCLSCKKERKVITDGNELYIKIDSLIYIYDRNELDFKLKYTNVADCITLEADNLIELRSSDGIKYYTTSALRNIHLQQILYTKRTSNDNYERINISQEKIDIATPFEFEHIYKIDESVIFAIGKNKLIAKSNDNGLNWNVLTFSPSGLEFKNYRNYSSNLRVSNRVLYDYSDEKLGYVPLSKDAIQTPRSFFDGNFIIDEEGNGISLKFNYQQNVGLDSVLVTNDYGNTYTTKERGNIRSDLSSPNLFISTDGKFYLYSNSGFGISWKFSFLYCFDKDFNLITTQFFDSTHIVDIRPVENGELLMYLVNFKFPTGSNAPNGEVFNKYSVDLKTSSDFGNTWKSLLRQEFVLDGRLYNDIFSSRRSSPNLFCAILEERLDVNDPLKERERLNIFYEINENIIDTIYTTTNIANKEFPLWKIGESYISQINEPDINNLNHQLSKKILESDSYKSTNTDVSVYDLTEIVPRWVSGSTGDFSILNDSQILSLRTDSNSIRINVAQADGKLIFNQFLGVSKSYSKRSTLILRPKTPSSVENSETETPRSRAFLHAGKPYPLPAVSTVSADLHWNAQYSASEAVLKVFDSMGNEIPNAKVELQQTNPYSGTVTWDCGAYPTGVYFIQVTIGTEQKNVGLAVVR